MCEIDVIDIGIVREKVGKRGHFGRPPFVPSKFKKKKKKREERKKKYCERMEINPNIMPTGYVLTLGLDEESDVIYTDYMKKF